MTSVERSAIASEPRVRGTRRATSRLELRASTAVELVLSLMAFGYEQQPAELDVEATWFAEAGDAVGGEVAEVLRDEAVPIAIFWGSLGPKAVALGDGAGGAAMVDVVASLR